MPWQHLNHAQTQLPVYCIGPRLEMRLLTMTGPGKGCSPEVVGSPGRILQGAGGPTGGVGASRTTPPSHAGCCGGGKGAAGSCEAPATAFHPLQARGFNLITCFICANLFFNQSCSARRKEATVDSFAPSCSKGEVNGSYPPWRCLRVRRPGSPLAGGCLARCTARL